MVARLPHHGLPMTAPPAPAAPAASPAPSLAGDLLATATALGLPALDLAAFDPAAVRAESHDEQPPRPGLLPLLQRGRRLFVAVADPGDLGGLDDVRLRTGLEPEPVLVESAKLAALRERARPDAAEALLAAADELPDPGQPASAAVAEDADAPPVVRYVQQVLLDAIDAGASDIHFEPYEDYFRVRLRVDGVLREAARVPPSLYTRLAARLKVLAALDVAERRLPQDGRIRLPRAAGPVDFRVSTLPTVCGEKVVLRLLDASAARLRVEQLGFEGEQLARYLAALRRPQGLVLLAGPTGSGKTVTLYAGLNVLNAASRNIATAEDPVEIRVAGINQVQTNPKIGLTFATALRAFLRQDPDVLMVGEMRDAETAQTAVKAAQTGHLVLSTVHANSAAETLARLRNMGVEAFNLAASAPLVVAQRLVRMLCRSCRRPSALPTAALEDAGFTAADLAELAAGEGLFEASDRGCSQCDHGYRGRTGIHEVVELTPPLQQLLLGGSDSGAFAEEARRLGYDDLRRAGLNKAMRGITSLAEVGRVLGEVQAAPNGANAPGGA